MDSFCRCLRKFLESTEPVAAPIIGFISRVVQNSSLLLIPIASGLFDILVREQEVVHKYQMVLGLTIPYDLLELYWQFAFMLFICLVDRLNDSFQNMSVWKARSGVPFRVKEYSWQNVA